MLVIHSLSKSYNEHRVLTLEALSLAPGVHLVKGENGAGKTTFFKCLAGIAACSGDISLYGISVTQHPVAYRYDVNFAEAEPLFPDFLTARDLIAFTAKTKKAPPEQVTDLCRRFGIEWFYEKSCGTYSSGMLKKLSLALAFLGASKMIILDEPLITLDEQTHTSLFQLINEKADTIFLISSHQAIENTLLNVSHTFEVKNKTLVLEK